VGKAIGLGMNPEFLREGVAVDDFIHPDRVVNGYMDEKTRQLLHDLYKDFSCPIIETSPSVAEMIKYASNCFLATKISFINEIGNMCKKLNIDVFDVADGMGKDHRIQRSFLNAGIGWGGSCFPKDTKALRSWAKKEGISSLITDGVIKTNDTQPLQLINILKKHIPMLKGRTIGILGLAFKPDTDDIRDSRARPIIESLIKEGAHIKAYDPKAMEHFKKIVTDIDYCSKSSEVLDADAILITTEWDEFRHLDYSNKIVIDGRRVLEAKKTAKIYDGVCW
jgi:UDPglucose 6-dehydrogenase